MEADKTPKTPAGVDMRNEVIDALLTGNASAVIPAPMWSKASVSGVFGKATVVDLIEDQMIPENTAALVNILALAAKSADKVLSLSAHALIAKMAAYHAWLQEDDIEPPFEKPEMLFESLQLDAATRELFQRVGGFNK